MASFLPNDAHALEIEWASEGGMTDVSRLITEGMLLGFRRISLHVNARACTREEILHAASLISGVPNALLVVDNPTSLSAPLRGELCDCARGKLALHAGSLAQWEFFRTNGSSESLLVDITEDEISDEAVLEMAAADSRTCFRFSKLRPLDFVKLFSKNLGKVRVWDELCTSALLWRHPCFTYLCEGQSCHCGRVCPPRRVRVSSAGVVSPYGLGDELALGDVRRTDLADVLSGCYEHEKGPRFLDLMSEVLSSYVLSGLCPVINLEGAMSSRLEAVLSCS